MNVFEDILNNKEPEKEAEKETEKAPELHDKSISKSKDFFDPDAKDERGIPLHYLDPRSDLTEDHEEWMDILNNSLLLANLKDGDKLFEILHFLRCSGAGLEKVYKGDMGLKLVPGHWDARSAGLDWAGVRAKYLDPIREDLIALFKYTKVLGRLPDPRDVFSEDGEQGQAGQEGNGPGGQAGQRKLVFGVDSKVPKKK